MTGTPMLRAAHRFPTSLKVEFLPAQGAFSGAALNISTGGLFVRTGERMRKGAVFPLALEFPDGEPPAPARAKVVHVAARAREPGVGMQFVDERAALRARVDRHIEAILRQGNAAALRLLSTARELLRKKGWTQLATQNLEGQLCLSGALLRAAGGDERNYRAALQAVGSRLRSAACAHGGFSCHCAVMRWNDDEGRTEQQVIAKIDEAIDAELGSGAAA